MKTSRFVSNTCQKIAFVVAIAVMVMALLLSSSSAEILKFVYTADVMPRDDGWTLQDYPTYEAGHVYLDPVGVLHMYDPETYNGSACQYYKDYPGSSVPITGIAAEWDVKAVSSDDGSHFWVDDGVNYFGFDIMTDSVRSWRTPHQVNAVTTDDYHTYRLELKSGEFRLFQDEILLFEGNATASCSPGEVMVGFGLGSSWGTAEFYLNETRAFEIPLAVDIDIMPRTCPNDTTIKGNGTITVAILGSADLDVADIDIASVRLEEIVAPVRSKVKDVSTPVSNPIDECDCTSAGSDGFSDLVLKFPKKGVVNTLPSLDIGDVHVLTLTGVLTDTNETPIEGTDCIVIVKNKGKND